MSCWRVAMVCRRVKETQDGDDDHRDMWDIDAPKKKTVEWGSVVTMGDIKALEAAVAARELVNRRILKELELDYKKRLKELKARGSDLELDFINREDTLLKDIAVLVQKQRDVINQHQQGRLDDNWVKMQQTVLVRWKEAVEKEKKVSAREEAVAARESIEREKNLTGDF
ncbi:hypothetical protein Tco_0835282 [Tanacetum coccineum]